MFYWLSHKKLLEFDIRLLCILYRIAQHQIRPLVFKTQHSKILLSLVTRKPKLTGFKNILIAEAKLKTIYIYYTNMQLDLHAGRAFHFPLHCFLSLFS